MTFERFCQAFLVWLFGVIGGYAWAYYHFVINPKANNTLPNILVKILNEKRQAGVDVKVLINGKYPNDSMHFQHEATIKVLRELKIPYVSFSKNATMHAKFIIIDDRKVFLGSHNLSNTALSRNYETSILITHKEVADEFITWFNERWNTCKPGSSN